MIEDVDATQTDRAPRVVRRGTPGSKLLIEVAVGNAGVRAGGRGCACLFSWAIAVHRTGAELGADVDGFGHVSAAVREYGDYWNLHERTAWRHLEAFTQSFPTEETPARLSAGVLAQYADGAAELEKQKATAGFTVAVAA